MLRYSATVWLVEGARRRAPDSTFGSQCRAGRSVGERRLSQTNTAPCTATRECTAGTQFSCCDKALTCLA